MESLVDLKKNFLFLKFICEKREYYQYVSIALYVCTFQCLHTLKVYAHMLSDFTCSDK